MIKKFLPKVQKNVSLAKYTTFKIGGPARYFYITRAEKDLVKAIEAAKISRIPFFILAGGSNILVADKGYEGLIIKIQNSKFKIQNYNSKFKIFCEAGTPLAKLVSQSFKVGATGLEWAAGIPGTVGGAIRGNAGAFGGSMADIIKTVTILEIKNKKLKIKKIKNCDCKFGYRKSIFKQNPNLIILSAEIQLKKGNKKEIKNKIKENLSRRNETQPFDFPSAGSVFKNTKKYPAAYLIEKCGLKGRRIGRAEISKKHANFIVNLGGAKAKDVTKLIDFIKKKVKNKFGIILEEEIQYLGF